MPPHTTPHLPDPDAGALGRLRDLDDPIAFVPDAGLRAGAERRGRHLRRRRHVGAVATSIAVTIVVLAGALGGYARWQDDRITRISMAGIPQVDASGRPFPPTASPGAFNVLVVGADTRPLGDPVTGERTDTMIIVRVDRDAGTVRLLSLPRDLWVPIADGHGEDRLNTAIQVSPDTLIHTVNQTLGIPIDHFVRVDFVSFETLVDGLGGVAVHFDAAVRDASSGLDQDAGCHVLGGSQALALARARHLEWLDATGRWQGDLTGDLGRERRQQVVAMAAVRQLGRQASPQDLVRLAGLADDTLTLDDRLGLEQLVDLGRWSAGLGPGAITGAIPPVRDAMRGTAAVLELEPDGAAQARDFLATGTPPRSGVIADPTVPATAAAAPGERPPRSTPLVIGVPTEAC